MRIVIIGGSHAGIAAARHLKQMDDKIEVIIIEKSNVLGYIASSLNLVLEGYIERLEIPALLLPVNYCQKGSM